MPAEEITYETLKKAIGKAAAQETLRSGEVVVDMDLVAEAGGFLKLSGPQTAAGSSQSLKWGVGLPTTACHHCVSRTPFPPLVTTISESFHSRARARWLVCANETYSV